MTSTTTEDANVARAPRRWNLRVLLPLLLCALVAGMVTPVVLLGYFVSVDTTSRFVGGRMELVLDGVEGEVRRQIEPVEAQLALARKAVAEGRIDARNPESFASFVLGLMAATPQVYGIGFMRPDGSMRRWERGSLREVDEPASNVPLGEEALAAARAGRKAIWGARPSRHPTADWPSSLSRALPIRPCARSGFDPGPSPRLCWIAVSVTGPRSTASPTPTSIES